MNSDQTGILKIHRIPNFVGRIRSYSILVDGTRVNSIKDGETAEIRLLPGHHNIIVKLDWTKSNSINVNIEPGQIKRLHIGREQIKGLKLVALKGFYILLILIGAITGIGAFIGVGVAMLVIHRTGKLKLF